MRLALSDGALFGFKISGENFKAPGFVYDVGIKSDKEQRTANWDELHATGEYDGNPSPFADWNGGTCTQTSKNYYNRVYHAGTDVKVRGGMS